MRSDEAFQLDAFPMGRKPAYDAETHPRITLRYGMTPIGVIGAVPSAVDWSPGVQSWPMYGNDTVGDCTIAECAHAIEVWNVATQRGNGLISDSSVLNAYSAVSGYRPGDPSTDNGAVMQDVFGYWRKTGIGSHAIDAFAQVDITKPTNIVAALYDFGAVHVGLRVTRVAMDQFNANVPWDVRGLADLSSPVLGGHAVVVVAADPYGLTVVSWGQLQGMTWDFWNAFIDEAWVTISEEWMTATRGLTPSGLNWAAFAAEFTRLTGEPFVIPTPAPTPGPTPAPGPADADVHLAGALRPWVDQHHVGANAHVAHAALAWLSAKGL